VNAVDLQVSHMTLVAIHVFSVNALCVCIVKRWSAVYYYLLLESKSPLVAAYCGDACVGAEVHSVPLD
jgi:hypothetical protein